MPYGRKTIRVAIGVGIFSLISCGGQPSTSSMPDTAAAWIDDGDFDVTLGVGESAFVTPTPGETLRLEAGSQGLQHLWVRARASGISEGRHQVTWVLRGLESPSDVVGGPLRLGLPLEGQAAPETPWAVTLVVPDVSAAVGRSLWLGVEVRSIDGRVGRDGVTLQVSAPTPPAR